MIRFSQVSKHFENTQRALNNVSFQLERGDMAFLTGPSGAGKSTLLRLIATMERPSSGDVIVSGINLSRLSRDRAPYIRRQIGLIFQDPHLLAKRTALENTALPLVIAGYRSADIEKRAHAALVKVGLAEKIHQLPGALSAGEKQRVGIARAIVTKPPLIIADEPTGNLDPDLSKDIMHLFEQFNQLGSTILIATHDLTLVEQMSYRVLRLCDGELLSTEEDHAQH
jgi:cell division transport system ATP-binding protein